MEINSQAKLSLNIVMLGDTSSGKGEIMQGDYLNDRIAN